MAKSIGQENLTKPELKTYIEQQLERIHNEKSAGAQEVYYGICNTRKEGGGIS